MSRPNYDELILHRIQAEAGSKANLQAAIRRRNAGQYLRSARVWVDAAIAAVRAGVSQLDDEEIAGEILIRLRRMRAS